MVPNIKIKVVHMIWHDMVFIEGKLDQLQFLTWQKIEK